MSYDRKIDQVCEHYVRDEALFLSADRVTVRPIRPISAWQSVIVRANGEEPVTPAGLLLGAVAKGTVSGPFTIGPSNGQLIMSVNSGPDQTLSVPVGAGMTTAQLAAHLQRQTSLVRFGVTKKNQLTITTVQPGPQARVQLKAGSTLAPVCGLPINRVWMGRKAVPGWSLIRDPNTLSDRPTRLIVFDEPLQGFQNFVEISYTTIRQECRRCGGLGVEHDWRYNIRGDVAEVRDEALLIQEILKLFYTIQGSNSFHQWYGTNILDTVGRKLTAAGIIQNVIVADLQEAFRRWQQVKKKQEEAANQVLSDEEFPFRLLSVALEQSRKDPTIIFVNSVIQNRSQKPIQITRGVRLPEPTDLLGATQQTGIFRQSLQGYTLTG